MAKPSDKSPVTFVRMRNDIRLAVKKLADVENRSIANMIEVLVSEALAQRKTA